MLRSPQFQQSIESFEAAIHSGLAGPLLNQFNLNLQDSLTIEALLRAIDDQVKREKQQK